MSKKKSSQGSVFLEGNFAPVNFEKTEYHATLEGTLPPNLKGMYLRNGPNPQFELKGRPYHWFDGDGMVHAVHFTGKMADDGQPEILYTNRYIHTEKYLKERKAGRSFTPTIGELISLSKKTSLLALLKTLLLSSFESTTANTAFAFHSRRLLALNEGGPPYQIIAPSLVTNGVHTFDGKLRSHMIAHPKNDPETGELIFVGIAKYFLGIVHNVVSREGELIQSVDIPLDKHLMMHDFAITKQYSLIYSLPFFADPSHIFQGKPLVSFDKNQPAQIGIFPRHGTHHSQIRWFKVEPCMIFHTGNAWEEVDEVILIACRGTEMYVAHPEEVAHLTSSEANKTFLYEFRFDLKTGVVRERQLSRTASDFPIIPSSKIGRKSRFQYSSRFPYKIALIPESDALVKFDLQTGQEEIFVYGEGKSGGEGVFLPNPAFEGGKGKGKGEEDDGFLVTFVFDEIEKKSELWFIDAKTMKGPVARVKLGHRVPHGFHGFWLSEEEINSQITEKLPPPPPFKNTFLLLLRLAKFLLVLFLVWKLARRLLKWSNK